ncbi:hypothetical protein QBC47DRAFT_368223, partial [Echria macrotheca]
FPPSSAPALVSSEPPSLGPSAAERVSKARRSSFPISFPFPPLFQSNTSSTSLAPSTAEGRPIPLDDSTTAHRTSALQKLNSTYPSEIRRHRYAKSTGAQSSTYSQPVLVRTYTGLPPPQTSYSTRGSRYRPSSGSRGVSRRVPLSHSSRQSTSNLSSRPIQPALSGIGSGPKSANQATEDNGGRTSGLTMPRHKSKKSGSKLPIPLPLQLPLPWQWTPGRSDHDEARLPPLEAFSFKSIMADMQDQGGESSINADLDRIAEICARSRYSLSNQYEVHVAPHGSGESFVGGGRISVTGHRRRGHGHGGPTLQAFNSDDDESAAARSHRKRRSGGHRKSVAYGTLETIMSSSRSSEEDQTKKKPAAEIASEVRGRASRKHWDSSAGSGSKSGSAPNELGSHSGPSQEGDSVGKAPKATLARKKSASFVSAVMDSSRTSGKSDGGAALLSEPALPQTSNTNLGVRTTPAAGSRESSSQGTRSASPIERLEVHLADELPHEDEHKTSAGGLLAWSNWIPWRTQPKAESDLPPSHRDTLSHAEGSLRQLLKSVDVTSDKGKAIDRDG